MNEIALIAGECRVRGAKVDQRFDNRQDSLPPNIFVAIQPIEVDRIDLLPAAVGNVPRDIK